ncbi:NucA/NucB deoxyribonuclease domain-containing protein [Streptomyces swartbergensis]|uniref:NucA/NucB deoxyribonuclease domain-containing protein n=1 Tax=Streptomyces swartbergensis TaxID=487165 RepID=UPI00381C8C5E
MRRFTRARLAAAIGAAALLLPLGAVSASAAPGPGDAPTDKLAIEMGKPQKATTLKKDSIGTKALDCSEGQFMLSRMESCSAWLVPVIYTLNEVPVGTAKLHSVVKSKVDPRDRNNTKYNITLKLTDPTHWGGLVTTGSVGFECNYCDVGESTKRNLVPDVAASYEMTVKSPGKAKVTDSIRPYATLDAPRHDSGSALIGDTLRPRCDNTPRITPVGKGGCVYPEIPALWEIDVKNPRVDAVGWHVLWAQKNLKQPWGVPGTKYTLQRTFSEEIQNANRAAACGPDVPRPPNRPDLSCDEYPFAQTYEGASKNPDYSCHFLDKDDNSREGSLRKANLNGQRTLEADSFYVRVINVPSAAEQKKQFAAMGPVGCGSD